MNIKDLVTSADKLAYKELGSALIEKFGVRQPVNWDSVLPKAEQHSLFGGEILRLIEEHPTLAELKEIRPVCLMKGELSQLLFFYVQLKDEKLPKPVIERITRKFVGGASADRYIIWFFGNKKADVLKVVISGREGKKIRLKTLPLEAGQWFKTYDYILDEVERKFNTGGLFQSNKEPSELYKAIWEAFDISIVNKKFYAEIKEVFDKLIRQELPKCKGVLTDEQERVQFAIRLIGRIIFCWFLKRKGIVKDDVMSSAAVRNNKNYYRDLLELLFFEVFNTPLKERRKDLPVSIKDYPFLNGGLFEPQKQDCKDNYALYIPDEWFEGFFGNTLEKYNFTIDENTAASAEIAIDPEMLGRIFENLLAEINPETGESARKSTGSFYTPREIVDFMVEESLIAYLKTGFSDNSPLSRGAGGVSPTLAKGGEGGFGEALEDFVRTAVLLDVLKPYTKQLLTLLNAIKVLDPASGSGAFPISILQKIVELKHVLDPQASLYDLKLKTLENSIYGVDIQPMATELSRLRCWLSLMVDEDPKDIKPLPNLDFKFVTANSLIDLGYDEFLEKVETGKATGLFLHEFKNKLNELRSVRQKYFDPAMGQKEKDKLKKAFNAVKAELYEMSLELIKQKVLDAEFAHKINNWEPFDDSKAAPFFSKEWMFGVMEGFDIVIANPPYIRHEAIKPIKPQLSKRFGKFYCGTADIYTYFYKAGIDSLKPSGHLCFIAPNKFMRAGYGKNTRTLLTTEVTPKIVIDFCDLPIFDATTYPAVILVEKMSVVGAGSKPALPNNKQTETKRAGLEPAPTNNFLAATFTTAEQLSSVEDTLAIIGFQMPITALRPEGWNLEQPEVIALMEKLRKAGKPLGEYVQGRFYYGIKTGFNEAFVIDEDTRKKLIAEDQKSEELIRPWLRGRDIKKWKVEWEGIYLISIPSSTNRQWPWSNEKTEQKARTAFEKTYPAIHNHLSQWEDKLIKRDDQGKFWWELRSCAYYKEFEGPKIIYPNITKTNIFAFDTTGILTNQKCFIIPTDDLCLLAILNSKLAMQWFVSTLPLLRGDFFEPSAIFMEKFPVSSATDKQKAPIITLVNQILTTKQKDLKADTSTLEKQIDEMVYKLYDLTPEEIAIVEGR